MADPDKDAGFDRTNDDKSFSESSRGNSRSIGWSWVGTCSRKPNSRACWDSVASSPRYQIGFRLFPEGTIALMTVRDDDSGVSS